MNNFVFQSPTRVSFGEHLAATAFESIKELGAARPLIVTDSFLYQSGAMQELLDDIASSGFEPVIFHEVPSDSDLNCVASAAALGRENACDSIIAFGGGSVMDTSKAVNICLKLGGDLLEYQGLNNLESSLLPLVAIPTTAGTGSEVSFVAMIKDKEAQRKLIFGSKYLAPDAALLDPVLLISLPAHLTAATGMDAITHNIECLAATITSSPFTDGLAIQSLKLLFDYLPKATKDGADIEARGATLVASTMAGCAFTNAGVGIVHALAHSVGALYGTHHGMTNAILLPHGMRFNLETTSGQYAKIARALGFSCDLDDNVASIALIEMVENLLVELELPRDLRSLGVPPLDEKDLISLVSLVMEDAALMFNPRMADEEEIADLFKRSF